MHCTIWRFAAESCDPAALLLLLLQLRWLMGPGSAPRPSICRCIARMIF
jgi:hypothetical protein